MKGILVIIDGLGDLDCKLLQGKTPLEAAEKENLDELAKKSKLGFMYTIKEGYVPESDEAVMSILGNNGIFSERGEFEALGAGLKVERGDLVLRTNFGTVESLSGRVIDRRAGRTLTSKEAEILGKALNSQIKLPYKFIFKPTIQHRGILVIKGGFSDNITNIDPSYSHKGKFEYGEKFKFSEPLDDDENSQEASNVVNEFVEQSFGVLDGHPINAERRRKGLLAANIILTRDAGIEIPKMQKLNKWLALVYMPLELGIAKAAGMDYFSFPYPELREHDVYKNLHQGLLEAIEFVKRMLKEQKEKYDYFYVHFKETDIPGHDNKPLEKKAMIELLDKEFFSWLGKFVEKEKVKVIVTADHSTPCKLKAHSADPVPVLFFSGEGKDNLSFSEFNARKGSLGKIYGQEILKKLGFN